MQGAAELRSSRVFPVISGVFFSVVFSVSNLNLCASQSIVLGWAPSPDPRTVGYFVHSEDLAGNPLSRSDVGLSTTAIVSGLGEGNSYVFYVTAYDALTLESAPSNEIIYQVPASVLGRYIFYNASEFDNNDAAPNASDDGAIAPDKLALLPGNTATFDNYTSYSGGINGIMLDIAGLKGTPGLADLAFHTGNDNAPVGWTTAASPISITVRSGAGVSGSSRVTLLWPNNAIQKRWLRVTVKATSVTGLATDDVFYFGNAIGEAGNSSIDAKVNATDEILARNNSRATGQAPIDFAYDFNRDSKVNATDQIIARNNPTSSVTALQLIQVP